MNSTNLHVICQVAGVEYALPASAVVQMESYSGATPVPGAPAYVEGLIQVRQQIVPVINARTRFALPAAAATSESRLVILQIGTRLVSLLVDSAREVKEIAHEEFQNADSLPAQGAGFVKSVAQIKGRIIMLLDVFKVIGEEKNG